MSHNTNIKDNGITEYEIVVKDWMGRKSRRGFDFMIEYNNDIPMPLLRMQGIITRQTYKMYYMKLRGPQSKWYGRCIKCGRKIMHPVSQYYGLSSGCAKILGIQLPQDVVDSGANFDEIQQAIHSIEWEGWVPKKSLFEIRQIPSTGETYW